MSTITTSDLFVKTYADVNYRFPAMVRHNGVVLAFAMDAQRRIYYTVLDFGAGGSMSMVDADHWSPNPRTLTFAREIASVGFGVADQSAVPTVRTGSTIAVPPGQSVRPDETDPFLSTTARFTAAVPFQVVSDGRYVYMFRQAISDPGAAAVNAAQLVLVDPKATPDAVTRAREVIADHQNMAYVSDATGAPVLDANGRQIPTVAGTVLVDRFVLVGSTLEPKLEVRYQRSGSRTRPAGTTDSLGAADLNRQPFVEPTQNLRFVPSVTQGRFAATLVPTQVAEVFRWQLFTHDAAGDVVWSYSVERTADGLFDTLGTQPLTCTDHPDVYAVTAGTCPRPAVSDPTMVCGKTLVAKVPGGGASGTALSFPTDGTGVVTIDGARATGTEFTIESWLAPDPAATGERVLIGGAGDPKAAGPSLWLPDPQTLRVGFGDGQTFRDVTTPPILASGEWNHLAVTYAAGQLQVYVNGQIQFASNAFGTAVPSPTAVAAFGAPAGGFAGRLDDVRIWSVALAAQDIQAGRHSTLTGLEAGLVGYWRFDEGTGTATWDAASGAKALLDGPAWVTSDAPIAVAPGLSRSALRLTGRSVTGGLTATLYYQQENAVSGYPGAQPAPLKQAARVMLAAVTGTAPAPGTPGAGTTAVTVAPTVVAVDFGVGVDGALAQLPGEISLSELDVPGGGPGTGADVLAGVFSAKADVATLTQTVADDKNAITAALLAQDAVASALAGGVTDAVTLQDAGATQAINTLVFANSRLASLQNPGGGFAAFLQPFIDFAQRDVQAARAGLQDYQAALPAKLAALTATLTTDQGRLAAAQANLDTLQRLLNGDTVLPMPLLHVDGSGLTTAGAVLGFA
ncbi:MAG TPA: LamG domain-containing protein, partial [Nakamurella sp.]